MTNINIITSINPAKIPEVDERLRKDLRKFLSQAVSDISPEIRARSWSGFDADFSRELGMRGYLGVTLPKEYGGQGLGFFARFVIVEELLNIGAPVGAHWIADRQSGPLILKYGTEAQRQFYLPPICRGESFFCIGMSEPNSGSDLASVRTRAVKTDNGWVLNGQKIWTTNAHPCHYMIAFVRTSGLPEDKHQGLSQVIIDLSLPGVVIRPITDLAGDQHFCEVFFENVELSEDALIGKEGCGWEQVTSELAFERSGPERIYSSAVLLDEWLDYLIENNINYATTHRLIGKLLSDLYIYRAMSIGVTQKLVDGESPVIEAALVKDLGTELEQRIPTDLADDLFSHENQDCPAELLKVLKYVTRVAPSFSLRGGTREILRGMIARGLGLR